MCKNGFTSVVGCASANVSIAAISAGASVHPRFVDFTGISIDREGVACRARYKHVRPSATQYSTVPEVRVQPSTHYSWKLSRDFKKTRAIGRAVGCTTGTGLLARDELPPLHWITSSAVAKSVSGMARPRALAVLRLVSQLELGRLGHRKVGWLFALEDAVDIAGGLAVLGEDINAVGHQAAVGGVIAVGIDRGEIRVAVVAGHSAVSSS
jgi:hypothetical protein